MPNNYPVKKNQHSKTYAKFIMRTSLLTLFLFCSCLIYGQEKLQVRTQRTQNLLNSLRKTADKGKFLFGHHDDTVYGLDWRAEPDHSDVKSVCGDYPALLGLDFGRLETGNQKNLDGVDINLMRKEIINQYNRGGVVTLSWHCYNPLSDRHAWVEDSLRAVESKTVANILAKGETHDKFISWLDRIADFINSLKTANGEKVPVIFRPWHEHTGSWFWWGQSNCTTEEFIALWRLTVDRLREKGVDNALYAYSTGLEAGGDPKKFMERYPGDDYIDIIGLDFYCFSPNSAEEACALYKQKVEKNVPMLCQVAKEHNKVPAITETGYEGLGSNDWWTKTLLPNISQYPVSYVLVWRNADDKPGHFYAPYPGHPSIPDFVKFYKDKRTLFAKDLKGFYK